MADVDIVVESNDLKVAIDLLDSYGLSFTKMVNKVQTESNRLERAAKATSAEIKKAWDLAEKAVKTTEMDKAAKEEKRILDLREQERKQYVAFLENKMKQEAAALKAHAQEEQRILNLREKSWKQFFANDFMKNEGTEINKNNSVLIQQLQQEELAAKEAAQATRELEAEKRYLTASYNPLLLAEQKYLQMQAEINRTLDLEIINMQQAEAQLKQLEREYQALGKGVYLAGSRFNQFGQMSGVAGKSANRFGMYAQQAGYQLGDFAVQIQSGTNAGVAFSQQFAQLAGLIPGVYGAIATFGAIGLGLLIQNLTRSKEESSELKDIVSDFEAFDEVFKSIGVSLDENFNNAIESVRENFGDLVADMTSDTTKNALERLVNGLNEAFKEGTQFNQTGEEGFFGSLKNRVVGTAINYGGLGPLSPMTPVDTSEMKEYNEAIKGLKEDITELGKAGYYTSTQLAEGFADFYEEQKAAGELTEDLLERLRAVTDEAGISDLVARLLVQRKELEAEAREEAEKMLQTMEDEATVRQATLIYGKDSVQVRQAELDIEYRKTKEAIEGLNVAETTKDTLYDAADAAYEAESATYSWADAMAQVNFELQGAIALLSSISGTMITRAGISAATAVMDAGGSAIEAEKARRRAEEDARLYQQQDRAIAEGSSSIPVYNMMQDEVDTKRGMEDEYNARLEELRESERESKKSARKGKKGSKSDAEKEAEKAIKEAEKLKEKLNEFFDDFELNMKQQERLLGVYGSKREELEKVIDIENRLGEVRHMVSQEQIEDMAEQELALERRLEREQAVFDTLSGNFENFLMDVVQGTSSIEDAFRSMFSNIIAEMYQQFVAKGAAETAGNAIISLFSAKGNAFGPGGVKYFAKGGVVDSATPFGYSGGLGVMGEAGPEAIMPLKRNSNGELGVQMSGSSGGDVVINHTWNIAANGDETIKAVIQQQIPAITKASKAAVIEGKRRGEKGL